MKINEVKEKIYKGIIAVIRIKDYELAKSVSKTLLRKGFHGIELTMTISDAPNLIKELKSLYPDKVIGAGTILTKEECTRVIKNGADFVVSPCLVEEVANVCNENEVMCLLGAATPTETYRAYQLGCSVVKAFPGGVLKPTYIKDIKGPMPYIEIMPSGGVSLENIDDWFKNGAYAVSVGSALYTGITKDNLEILEERADRYLEEVSKNYADVY